MELGHGRNAPQRNYAPARPAVTSVFFSLSGMTNLGSYLVKNSLPALIWSISAPLRGGYVVKWRIASRSLSGNRIRLVQVRPQKIHCAKRYGTMTARAARTTPTQCFCTLECQFYIMVLRIFMKFKFVFEKYFPIFKLKN